MLQKEACDEKLSSLTSVGNQDLGITIIAFWCIQILYNSLVSFHQYFQPAWAITIDPPKQKEQIIHHASQPEHQKSSLCGCP